MVYVAWMEIDWEFSSGGDEKTKEEIAKFRWRWRSSRNVDGVTEVETMILSKLKW